MGASDERLLILEMIESGKLTTEEGLRLLNELQESEDSLSAAATPQEVQELSTASPVPTPEIQEDLTSWKQWWIIPFWIGVGITVLGAALMYWAFSAHGVGVWFILTWLPFLLGLSLLVLGWRSQTSPWLHLRIEQEPGETPQRIAISLPIPIYFTARLLKRFGHLIPDMDATGLDEVILALGDSAQEGHPLSILVDEGESGDRVRIYIG